MTATQREALAKMYDKNLGAVLVNGYGWVWPQMIRESNEVAVAVLARIA